MRIGVFFNSNPTDGGGFQQKIMVLDILKEKNDNYDLKLICSNKDVICNYSSEYDIINIYEWFKLFRFLKFINQIKIRTLLENLLIYILRYQLKKKCDILYYLGPTDLSFRIGIPYIFTVNDLMHRYYPNFPEISQNNEYDRREYMYSNGFKYALAIVTDSEIGKEDVINFYNINCDKIFSFPFLPPEYIYRNYSIEDINLIKNKYNLPSKYLFYPANFWEHKNHLLIIKALSRLRNKGITINLVLTGSKINENYFNDLMTLAKRLDVFDQINYLGRIPNEDIPILYHSSIGLVMPTYFGPTNIPYLEAFFLNCPVITSNLRGIKEQVKDAAILIDPNNPQELEEAINELMNNKKLEDKLIKNGKKIIEDWDKKSYSDKLEILFAYCKKG